LTAGGWRLVAGRRGFDGLLGWVRTFGEEWRVDHLVLTELVGGGRYMVLVGKYVGN
jgi:hypothetical protein